MEQYPNLPGFIANIREDGLQIMPTAALTNRVLLIGTASKGPLFTPIRVSKVEDADSIFGAYHNDGKIIKNGKVEMNLLLALRQAYGAGCRDIVLVRIPNGLGSSLVLKDSADSDGIILRLEQELGSAYDDKARVVVNANSISLWSVSDGEKFLKDESQKATATIAIDEFDSLEEIADAINEVNDITGVVAELADGATGEGLKAVEGATLTNFQSFEIGTDYSEEGIPTLKTELAKAYDLLLDFPADIVVPVGFYVDVDITTKLVDKENADKLADFCAQASKRSRRTIGVISTSPLTNPTPARVALYVNALIDSSFSNLYPGGEGENGKFISITVGEFLFNNGNIGTYSDTQASAYAGLISSLRPHSSTTNKIVANAIGLKYVLQPQQLNDLSAKRLVTFRNKLTSGIVCTDGITCAKPGSDFTRLSTLRIANSVVSVVRQVSEPFIGEALDNNKYDAIKTAIDSALNNLQDDGAILDKEFSVYFANEQDSINGILTIELSIVPAMEVRRIVLKLALTPTLG